MRNDLSSSGGDCAEASSSKKGRHTDRSSNSISLMVPRHSSSMSRYGISEADADRATSKGRRYPSIVETSLSKRREKLSSQNNDDTWLLAKDEASEGNEPDEDGPEVAEEEKNFGIAAKEGCCFRCFC